MIHIQPETHTVRIPKRAVYRVRAGDALRTRNSSKGWGGITNRDKPPTLHGVSLVDRVVRVPGNVELGCCSACCTKLRSHVATALADVRAELPEQLTGVPPRYKCFCLRKCTQCSWERHEGQMRKLRALMGGGTYYGGCPSCPAENGLFGPGTK